MDLHKIGIKLKMGSMKICGSGNAYTPVLSQSMGVYFFSISHEVREMTYFWSVAYRLVLS